MRRVHRRFRTIYSNDKRKERKAKRLMIFRADSFKIVLTIAAAFSPHQLFCIREGLAVRKGISSHRKHRKYNTRDRKIPVEQRGRQENHVKMSILYSPFPCVVHVNSFPCRPIIFNSFEIFPCIFSRPNARFSLFRPSD